MRHLYNFTYFSKSANRDHDLQKSPLRENWGVDQSRNLILPSQTFHAPAAADAAQGKSCARQCHADFGGRARLCLRHPRHDEGLDSSSSSSRVQERTMSTLLASAFDLQKPCCSAFSNDPLHSSARRSATVEADPHGKGAETGSCHAPPDAVGNHMPLATKSMLLASSDRSAEMGHMQGTVALGTCREQHACFTTPASSCIGGAPAGAFPRTRPRAHARGARGVQGFRVVGIRGRTD